MSMEFDPSNVERFRSDEPIGCAGGNWQYVDMVRASAFDELHALYRASKEDGWVSVKDMESLAAVERDDSCCLDPQDVERYTISLFVWDEDDSRQFIAAYDFRENVWEEWSSGCVLTGVTHYQLLPSPPSAEEPTNG